MTAVTHTSPVTRTAPIWRAGVPAAIAAAVATTAIAAAATGMGVPVAVDGAPIPLLAFAQLTLIFSVVGLVLAKALNRWAAKPRRTFIVTTVALTVLSIVPDLLIGATTATRITLILCHFVAAAIVIPAVAARLADSTR